MRRYEVDPVAGENGAERAHNTPDTSKGRSQHDY